MYLPSTAPVPRFARGAEHLGLGQGLLAPGPGHHVVRGLPGGAEVHRDQRELPARATLHEAHGVGVRHIEQLGQERFTLLVDLRVRGATVAVLDERHARALVIEELALGVLESGERESGRTGAEIDDATHGPRR